MRKDKEREIYIKAFEGYFDEIYLYSVKYDSYFIETATSPSSLQLALFSGRIDNEVDFASAKGEVNSLTMSKFLNSEFCATAYKTVQGIRICFYKLDDNTYSKILFMNGDRDYMFATDTLSIVIGNYFFLNKKINYKAFNQEEMRDKFIQHFIAYFPQKIRCTAQNTLDFSSNKDSVLISNKTGSYHSQLFDFDYNDFMEMSFLFKELSYIFFDIKK